MRCALSALVALLLAGLAAAQTAPPPPPAHGPPPKTAVAGGAGSGGGELPKTGPGGTPLSKLPKQKMPPVDSKTLASWPGTGGSTPGGTGGGTGGGAGTGGRGGTGDDGDQTPPGARARSTSPADAPTLVLAARRPDGRPVAGLLVLLVDDVARVLASGRTDADGRLRLATTPGAGQALLVPAAALQAPAPVGGALLVLLPAPAP